MKALVHWCAVQSVARGLLTVARTHAHVGDRRYQTSLGRELHR